MLLNTCIKLLAFGCSYFDWDLCSSKWKQHSLKHKYKNIHVSTNLPWTNRHKNFIWYFALYYRSFFSSDTKVIWLQNCHSLNVRWDCVMSVVQEKKRCGVSQVLTRFFYCLICLLNSLTSCDTRNFQHHQVTKYTNSMIRKHCFSCNPLLVSLVQTCLQHAILYSQTEGSVSWLVEVNCYLHDYLIIGCFSKKKKLTNSPNYCAHFY